MREMVAYSLKEAGYEAVTAGDGQQALDALEKTTVDLIISDLNMPVMDGLTFIKEARAREPLKSVPILMLTTEAQQSIKDQAKAAGATGWLVKPFNPAMLLKVLEKVIP